MNKPEVMLAYEVADHLRVHRKTLIEWAKRGFGPPRHKVGNRIYYLRHEVDSWHAQTIEKTEKSI